MSTAIPITSVSVGPEEEASVLAVLRSGILAQGPVVAELERKFAELCGVKHAVAVSNGTVSLVAALKALDVKPGDEVITTPFSFVATLNAILESGATVRFADITEDFTIDPESIKKLVNERTKVIMPVHLYGLPADMEAITKIADEHGLAIVEDAAQAHGAKIGGKATGSFGIGSFSLYATKNIQCGEGGILTTNDDTIADTLRVLRNQGMRVRYQYEMPGHNWRLTDLQAAIAVPQLARYADICAKRAANAAYLSKGLAGVAGLVTPSVPEGREHVWHQYTLRVTDGAAINRDDLLKVLTEEQIGHGLYYPKLMHDYDCYRGNPQIVDDPTPLGAKFVTETVSIPVNQFLTTEQLDRIISVIRGAFNA